MQIITSCGNSIWHSFRQNPGMLGLPMQRPNRLAGGSVNQVPEYFMNSRLLYLVALLLVEASTAFAGDSSCLKYEPETVTIIGKLHRETFPGPPNFESVANGDEAETGFYLSLESPICTVGDGGADQVPFDSVREIQLVLNEKQYAILRPKLGSIVTLQGNIFSAFTGHHHADVLMRVSN
ncbi:DUF4431 domain-containing protein [Duganella sp. FT80W]|uniref:DUF4431 domain-containing protein n=1 Tax=Duganella guangzhouensis TaxID=2666084 RepID=A0A6I2L2W1_9BURK|nr:DUF4431 domain-containing protein [Duganella guangzhouensis]MRW90649.1 DUF4431 domain-containing protein [Duganella guangzhouensis]